jgi:CheY-like chemotaxis protein
MDGPVETDFRAAVADAQAELARSIQLAGLTGWRRLDLLVADIGLPGGLNGRQLADAARSMAADLPILLITG